jgi:hypothetical protein
MFALFRMTRRCIGEEGKYLWYQQISSIEDRAVACLLFRPVALLAHLLEITKSLRSSTRALFPTKAAEKTRKSVSLLWRESIEWLFFVDHGRRRRNGAEWNGCFGEDVAAALVLDEGLW